MRQVIGLVLAAALLGGCAVYADPYSGRASAGIFVPPHPPPPSIAPEDGNAGDITNGTTAGTADSLRCGSHRH